MADTKISALTASTTPLAGTEVLPIVQSGTTKQVSVANLTAGRAISASAITASTGDITSTAGNFVVGTSGKGIDFSATPGTGTSELLADYEEGTFVATLTPSTSGSITLGDNNTLSYTKTGRVVVVNGLIIVDSVSLPVGTNVQISTLPFTPATISPNAGRSGGAFGVFSTTAGDITPGLLINSGTTITYIVMTASTVQAGTSFYVQFTYISV
jgi:hypothetical protein